MMSIFARRARWKRRSPCMLFGKLHESWRTCWNTCFRNWYRWAKHYSFTTCKSWRKYIISCFLLGWTVHEVFRECCEEGLVVDLLFWNDLGSVESMVTFRQNRIYLKSKGSEKTKIAFAERMVVRNWFQTWKELAFTYKNGFIIFLPAHELQHLESKIANAWILWATLLERYIWNINY